MSTKSFATALIAAAGFVAVPSFANNFASGEVGYIPPVSVAASDVTRAEVRAEVLQAQRAGELPVGGEVGDVGAVASSGSATSREAVRNEAVYAVQHGLIVGGEV